MKIIKRYVRNKKNRKIGVVIAIPINKKETKYRIGWSLCSKKDIFDKEVGESLAVGRAVTGNGSRIPHTVVPVYDLVDKKVTKMLKNK